MLLGRLLNVAANGKTGEAFERGIIELLVNGGIVVALVFAIFMTRAAERQSPSKSRVSSKSSKN